MYFYKKSFHHTKKSQHLQYIWHIYTVLAFQTFQHQVLRSLEASDLDLSSKPSSLASDFKRSQILVFIAIFAYLISLTIKIYSSSSLCLDQVKHVVCCPYAIRCAPIATIFLYNGTSWTYCLFSGNKYSAVQRKCVFGNAQSLCLLWQLVATNLKMC